MKPIVHNHVACIRDIPMLARHRISTTLADWRTEANIKRSFGWRWVSQCGTEYDLSALAGVSRKTVKAIYLNLPKTAADAPRAMLIVFQGVSYEFRALDRNDARAYNQHTINARG